MLIKLFKRKPPATAHQPNEQEPLLPGRQKQNHSAYFDLNLARVSLVVELISYTLMALVITPGVFTILSMASALGTGFSPAIQSVALELYASQGGTETGKLFGALSVVQSLRFDPLHVWTWTTSINPLKQFANYRSSNLRICLHEDSLYIPSGHLPGHRFNTADLNRSHSAHQATRSPCT